MTGSLSERLRDGVREAWETAAGHRFTVELMAGTVPDAVMARYLVQDHRFLDEFLGLLGAAMAGADRLSSRIRLGRFAGAVAGEENTYFLRAFAALGVTEERRRTEPHTAATAGFKAIMQEAAATRSYAAALSVLAVAEWLYLDWAQRAPAPAPGSFVHAEWITLHDNSDFRDLVGFLRTELDRVGPVEEPRCRDLFGRAVALEGAFFDAAYAAEGSPER